jgi:1,4-alpha-glucan branching enzyme
VWAPNARGVRVLGDFTGWGPHDGWPMRSLGSSGVWELFVPAVSVGERYKYRILGRDGMWREKADPLAQQTEAPPRTASVVTESRYDWKDADWLARRAEAQWYKEPISVYEVHLGSWRPGLSYVELADQLTDYVAEHGFTHVELMPVMEHPFGGSWGYQVTGYYAPTARFGDPDGLRHLVDRLHQAGVGVILDWVPAHFPRDEWALARFDGTPLYEHQDPRRGEHPDWGTYVFDFGRPEVRNFLVANALYWCDEFHADGLRVDAVASMLYLDYSREHGQWAPNEYGGRENLDAISFIQEMNATVYKHHPGVVTIAEESTAWPGVTRPTYLGGLGFGFKWNMGWMNDTLRYMVKEPIYRQWHHHEMTFATLYAWSENYILPISHDEVVHGKGSLVGKMPGDLWRKLANTRALLAFMWSFPGKQLLFMGSELADEQEWSESRGLDWDLLLDPARAGMQRLVRDLNRAYRDNPPLWTCDTTPDGFAWISAEDSQHNTFSFVRYDRERNPVVCIVNFAGVPHENYRIGLPHTGTWTELVNTDSVHYGGSGVGNLGAVHAEELPWHAFPASAALRVPPLGAIWLRPA